MTDGRLLLSDGHDAARGNDLDRYQFVMIHCAISVSSFLSLCGSASIVRLLRRQRQRTRSGRLSVHHRVLRMISLMDCISSASNLVHFYLLPQDKTLNPFAVGNDATCTVVGVVLSGVTVMLSVYNAFVGVNFLLQVRYKWTDERIGRTVEPAVHVAAVLLGLPLPVFAASQTSMNPDHVANLCIMKEYPDNCHIEDRVPCQRGEKYGSSLARLAALVMLVVAMIGFGSIVALYVTVRNTIRGSGRFRFASQELDVKQKQRLRRVSWQCTMYGLAYFNTILWPTLNTIGSSVEGFAENQGDPLPFTLIMICYMAFPLQGMLNFIIFVTPRYGAWRRALPDEPWTYVIRCAVSGEDPPTGRNETCYGTSRTSRIRNAYSSRLTTDRHSTRQTPAESHATETPARNSSFDPTHSKPSVEEPADDTQMTTADADPSPGSQSTSLPP